MLNTDCCERLLNSQKGKDNQAKDIIQGGAVSPLSTFTQWTGNRDFACMSVTKHEYPLLPAMKPSCDNTYLEKAAY